MGPLEFIYYLGYRCKTSCDVRAQRRLDTPVVSIGNITTGGTGKTPVTIAVAEEAVRRGIRPCVLTRGYRGSLKGPVRIRPDMKTSEAGDEPLLIARTLKDVPVIKCADRYAAGKFALSEIDPRPDFFILDDGFQHRRLCRDVDVLLVNAHAPFDNEKLLPMGKLREPVSEVKRADAIAITKKSEIDVGPLENRLRALNADALVEAVEFSVTGVFAPSGQSEPAGWLKDKDAYGFCGLGDPESFKTLLIDSGVELKGFRAFGDHHAYTSNDIKTINDETSAAGASWILTTEKDIMRLRGLPTPGNLRWLVLACTLGPELVDYILLRIK